MINGEEIFCQMSTVVVVAVVAIVIVVVVAIDVAVVVEENRFMLKKPSDKSGTIYLFFSSS